MPHYDDLETRTAEERTATLRDALPKHIAQARNKTSHYNRLLADVDPRQITDSSALAQLPVTRKSDLHALQDRAPPFGGLAAISQAGMQHIYQSPGFIHEFDVDRPDYWRMARAFYAAGLRAGMLVHNAFSYHLTPAGFMMESAARALRCPVFPAGVGHTELQAQALARLQPQCYVGTPSFLRVLLDKAAELNLNASSLQLASVGGEALTASLRLSLRASGVAVYQSYGTAEIGLIAYESPALEGMIVDEGVILEIVSPGGGDTVTEGEIGEVVVTTLNPEYPLIRFATGDLSAILPGPSPCGRTNVRIKGWLGRADQTTKVRGMFVHPQQVAEIIRRHPEITRGRLIVSRKDHNDILIFRCTTQISEEGRAAVYADSVKDVCKLRGTVEFVAAGELPDDGKYIEDIRSID